MIHHKGQETAMKEQLTDKLRLVTNGVYKHWCPGCKKIHEIDVLNVNHHCWSFSGNMDYPTFRPSIKIMKEGQMVCHYNLVEGIVHFFGDSEHDLKWHSVALDDIPDDQD